MKSQHIRLKEVHAFKKSHYVHWAHMYQDAESNCNLCVCAYSAYRIQRKVAACNIKNLAHYTVCDIQCQKM